LLERRTTKTKEGGANVAEDTRRIFVPAKTPDRFSSDRFSSGDFVFIFGTEDGKLPLGPLGMKKGEMTVVVSPCGFI
jgi:hypothetical protein